MSNIQQRKSVLPRWVLRLIGFSSLATVLVSLSLYLYKRSSTQRRINRSTHDSSDQDDEVKKKKKEQEEEEEEEERRRREKREKRTNSSNILQHSYRIHRY
jgi:biopolymer transport protein ExbB/TolQ